MSYKIVPTQEMLDDFSLMGDDDYSAKWGISRRLVIKIRKEYGLKSFNKVGKTIDHRFENGIEYKWCQRGHWEIVSEFYKCPSRNDGLRCFCKYHSRLTARELYVSGNYNEVHKLWQKTEVGKLSRRMTWRNQSAKKRDALISWTRDDEEQAYNLFEGRCAYCGKSVPIARIEFDHFIPVSGGGKTEPSNMIPCCTRCNHGRDGKFDREALEWLSFKFGETRGKLIYDDVLNKIGTLR